MSEQPDHAPSTSDELFGEEDLGFEPAPPPKAPSRGLPFKPIFAVGLVLLIALLWYVSSVHHTRFYLEVDSDRVVVKRGLYLPFGTSRWTPTSAYDTFALPAGVVPSMTGAMSHDEMDRVLRELFVRIARAELDDLQGGDAERAEDMLMRAHKLRHTTPQQDREIFEMLGDVSFRRGLSEVRGIQERFDEALKQFRLATRQGGNSFKGAQKWVDAIEGHREAFRRLAEESGMNPDHLFEPPTVPTLFAPPAEPEAPEPPTAPDAGTP